MKVIIEPNEELLIDFRDTDGIQFAVTYNHRGIIVYVGQDKGESGVIYHNPAAVPEDEDKS